MTSVAIVDPPSTFAAVPAPQPYPQQQPLTPEHYRQLADAQLRAKKVRRAVSVAAFDGWSVGVFGGLTLLVGMFSVAGWVMGVGMLAVAYVELTGRDRLRRMEPGVATRLGWNQLALAGLLIGYAAWGLYNALLGPDPLAATIAAAPETAELLAPYSGFARMISAAVYVGVALIAVFAQGGTAWYYFSREKHVRAYREQTPAWIVELTARTTAV